MKLIKLFPDADKMSVKERHEINYVLNLTYLYDTLGVEETEKQLKLLSNK